MAKKTVLGIAATTAALAMSASIALADASWDCLAPALSDELTRKLTFQDELAALIGAERPEFTDIANVAAAATKENFQIRLERITWLWAVDPGRFASANDIWVLDWRDEDMAAWLAENSENAATEERLLSLNDQLAEHPQLGSLREFLASHQGQNPFLELFTTFGQDISADREIVASCFEN